MAREIESVHTFDHQTHEYGMEKEKTVIRCDDGAVYEFEESDSLARDTPPRLVRVFQPEGHISPAENFSRLPEAVDETVETLFGGWSK